MSSSSDSVSSRRAARLVTTQRVVGIGGTVGALPALQTLLGGLRKTRATLVVAISPFEETELRAALADFPGVKMTVAGKTMRLEQGNLYVLRNLMEAVVVGETLVVAPQQVDVGRRLDVLFLSLAIAHRQQSIGVVLSGTEHDGVQGLRAIQRAGGLRLVQSEGSAAYKEGPQVCARYASAVGPPRELGERLRNAVAVSSKKSSGSSPRRITGP